MLPFIIIGLADGSIYAIAALGLTMSYKTSGVFNFAHGAVAAGAAYIFFQFRDLWGLPWPIAAVVAIGGYGVLSGLLMERFARRLAEVSTAAKIAGTLGVLLVIQYAVQIHYGTAAQPFPSFLPTHAFRLPGVRVEASQMITVAIALLTAGGLAAFFKRARLGMAMRAVVDDPGLLDLTGTSPARVRRAAWVISCCFSALSGILIAPRLGLDAGLLTLLVVQAYSAAAIGAFTNLPLVYAGGLAVGVAQQVAYYELSKVNNFALDSLPSSIPFLILFLVLLVLPKDRLRDIGRAVSVDLSGSVARVAPRTRKAALLAGFVGLVLVPFVVGPKLPEWSAGLTEVMLFLSLALLVRTSNQVSLCQVAFAAVGASSFAHLAGNWGVPWVASLLLAGLAAVPLGAIVAIPAIRLSGLFLALATFGFGILLSQVGYRSFLMFGSSNGIAAPRPSLGGLHVGTDTGYYYVILAVVVGGVLVMRTIEGSRLGRLLRGLGGSPVALVTHGASVNVTRVIVFSISAFLAGISGALFAPLNGSVTGSTFPYFNSVALLAVLAVAAFSLRPFGDSVVLASFAAAGTFEVLPGYFTGPQVSLYLQVAFGALAVIASMYSGGQASRERVSLVPQHLVRTAPGRLGRGPVLARTRGRPAPALVLEASLQVTDSYL